MYEQVLNNLQNGRLSQAALFDAIVFTSMQFFFNRSTHLRIFVNLISCFSWHFCKRFDASLFEERGTDLAHLLSVLFIYSVSIYASIKWQPMIDCEVRKRGRRVC
mmetsp:Transcript_38995/g.62842  ORF Transcript_38995/g.62842 Transcript_38995/m.62842 type:complete len:105 (+) Transcript_38995:49-363(+)